jgi:hypothetical protein
MGSSIVDEVASKQSILTSGLAEAQDGLRNIEQVYSEFSKIRAMIDTAFLEESNASFRISNELESIKEAVKRISYELVYIKEERQKLRIRVKKEYPQLPLPELLSTVESYNSAWTDLVGNTRLNEMSA